MTNYEYLCNAIKCGDKDKFLEWLEEYSMFFDPGGWFDDDNVTTEFLNKEWKPVQITADEEKCQTCAFISSPDNEHPICVLRSKHAAECKDDSYDIDHYRHVVN